MQVWLILRYLNILIANGCSLARQCCQVVPNLLRMFQLFTSNLQLVGQQWWPGHCPSPGGFQRVLPLMPERALSATSPNRNTSIFLLWPFTAAFVIRFHANWAENPSVETTNYCPGNPHTRLFFPPRGFSLQEETTCQLVVSELLQHCTWEQRFSPHVNLYVWWPRQVLSGGNSKM